MADPQSPASTAYDVVSYTGRSYPQTHPDRMATLATLYGLSPPPLAACRVLELGCGDGANLLPVALALPGSTCVGIDLSAEAVARGRELAGEAGIGNVSLLHMDVTELPRDFGEFDYVIAHGLYSWVPPAVQERVLEICKARLSPNGIAYVSYNAMPGCRIRQTTREMMRYHVAGIADPAEKVARARALVKTLAEARDEADPWGRVLRWELEHVGAAEAGPIFHDDLAEVNEPLYFHEFAARAVRHGLQFLSEAQFTDSLLGRPGEEPPPGPGAKAHRAFVAMTRGVAADDVVAREQYADFLRGRKFRQTLLCHAGVDVKRPAVAGRVESLYALAALRPESAEPDVRSNRPEKFTYDEGVPIQATQPVPKAALVELSRRWPMPVAFDELLAATGRRLGAGGVGGDGLRRTLATFLFYCYSNSVLELRSHAPPVAAEAGPRPAASALARAQAKRGPIVTDLLGGHVRLDTPLTTKVLELCDGTRDRDALVRELSVSVLAGKAAMQKDGRPVTDPAEVAALLRQGVESSLKALAKLALLAA